MKKITTILLGFFITSLSFAGTINSPVLMPFGGKAAACLEKIVKVHVSLPGDNAKIIQWQGPGVKASSSGEIDPSTAAYVFTVSPSLRSYAILFNTNDDNGWRLFSYQENNQLRLGYKAASMDTIGMLFEVNQRNLSGGDDEIDTTEIDLTPCAGLFVK